MFIGNQKKSLLLLLILFVFCYCGKALAAPIIVQGQSEAEMQFIADQLEEMRTVNVGPFLFYEGLISGKQVVVSKTLPGSANAAVATYIAIEKYHPRLIINQGMARGYVSNLSLYDIVVGEKLVNLNAFTTPMRAKGRGSNTMEWEPTQMSKDIKTGELVSISSSVEAVDFAMSIKSEHKRGKVVKGIVASSDTENNEYDRINMFAQKYGIVAEEQEGFLVAQICNSLNIPFLSVRVVAANVINNLSLQAGAGVASQAYVLKIIRFYK